MSALIVDATAPAVKDARFTQRHFCLDNYRNKCDIRNMSIEQPKGARFGTAIGAGLFRPPPRARSVRRIDDAQACIRSALRRRRRALGLTQEAAGRILGMPRLTYHRIEAGTRRIHFADLAAICTAFGCDIGELLQDATLTAAYAYAANSLL
jgi:DNA-binding XRE family transcriptional regulator